MQALSLDLTIVIIFSLRGFNEMICVLRDVSKWEGMEWVTRKEARI